jgi:hypothetical protein
MAMNQYSQQAAQLRAGEMATARAQYSSAAEAARQGDTQYAQLMLQAQSGDRDAANQVAFNNLQATMQTRQLNEAEAVAYEQIKQQMIANQMNAAQAGAQLRSSREEFDTDAKLREWAARQGFNLQARSAQGALGGGIGAAVGGTVGALGFLGGPVLGAATTAAGAGIGKQLGTSVGYNS